jgi:tRNA threonylcarbamoyladenosine biosynthesis protein TsaE
MNMVMKFKKEDLPSIAKDLMKMFEQKNVNNKATVVALYGDLGAGKTTLTQEIASLLSIKENVISPTFVIMKNYKILNKDYKWKNLIHIDAYRIENPNEISRLGFNDFISNKDNLVIIEWPEKLGDYITDDCIKLELKHIDEETREIVL